MIIMLSLLKTKKYAVNKQIFTEKWNLTLRKKTLKDGIVTD